jgi:hypothetical protein
MQGQKRKAEGKKEEGMERIALKNKYLCKIATHWISMKL